MKTLLCLIACSLLWGCSTLGLTKVHDAFPGLRGLYESNVTTSVLVVHGMGYHSAGYSNQMQAGIMQRLDSTSKAASSVSYQVQLNGYPVGVVTRTQFTSPAGKRVVFVELEWSDATRPIKRVLLGLADDDRERGFLQENRLSLNSAGKSFINSRLSDPMIYGGAFGEVLRGAAKTAICILLRGDKDADSPQCDMADLDTGSGEIAIISSSMGSSLVFDTVSRLNELGTPKERVALSAFLQRSKRIYMFANQIPLLDLRELGDVTGPNWLDAYPCPEKPPSSALPATGSHGLRNFLILRRNVAASDEALPSSLALNVVAFSDPNDLLTYGFSERFKSKCAPARFANVTVTNAKAGWFFVAANPIEAHTGYDVNTRVLDLIVHGGVPDQ
ncbi:hypothetical protein [Variovorax boronicumulans]|uniref:hypothetical protein n=1 Tax=Variovorax boronicumulans TaxID=436515 RepID=UPI00085BEED7|nr:hypothetical protein [Variovorax boronicumulans]OEZ29179.1 hypothetical protein AO062_20100 [Variovorax boronicumulans]